MRTLMILAAAAVVVTGWTHEASARERPYLFFQKADVPALREKVQTDPVARAAFAGMVRSLERGGGITLPPPDAEIRTSWRQAVGRSGRIGKTAAFCYLMTGERRYLELAREFLLTYARHFDRRVNFHRFDDKSYMRMYFTGALGIDAAWTYDMIHDELTEPERRLIEEDLLRGIVQMVKDSAGELQSEGNAMAVDDYEWRAGQWNGVVYCNAGITAVGFALDDPAIYEHGVANWKTYLARDLLSDGMWQEEDYVYATFCMAAMVAIAEMAHQFGYHEDLWTAQVPSKPFDQWDQAYGSTFAGEKPDVGYRTLRSYFDAQLDYQYPNLAAGNWGWQMNRAGFTNSNAYVTFYELAYRRYDDPGYAWFLARMERHRGDRRAWGPIAPILYHQPLPADPTPRPTASRWYDHGRWIVLKSIEGSDYWGSDAIYAFMPYGPYRTKALERMSVDLFAFGKVIAPRVSKLSRHQSAVEGFYIYANDWNNVQVNGENLSARRMEIADAHMRFHAFTPEVKIAQPAVTVQRRTRPSIWEDESIERRPDLDYRLSRALALTDTYLVDIARVRFLTEQAYRHNFHWNWHAFGELTLEGIGHDELTREPWSAVWRDTDDIGLKTTMLRSGTACATKVLWRASPHNQYVVAARSDRNTTFVAIHEPFRSEPRITAVTELLHADGRVAMKIAGDTFTDYLGVAYEADSIDVNVEGLRLAGDGPWAYLRVADGTVTARGEITALRVPAAGIERVVLNGREVAWQTIDGAVVVGR